MFTNNGNNVLKFNLDQGKQLLTYNDSIDDITKPNLQIIAKGTFIESMSNHTLSGKDKKSLLGLETIENEFNKTLSEYSTVYKQFSEDLLQRNESKKNIVDYLGKTVSAKDAIVYVNSFGYYHWYSQDAWNNKNESCSSEPIEYAKDMSGDFKKGPDMNKGQPCSMAGKVIKNKDADEYAWVDIAGYKHIFPQGTNMSTSCAEVNVMNVSANDFNLIPSGNAMSATDECLALDVNPGLWTKLQDINKKLKNQAKELNIALGKLHLDSDSANKQLQDQRTNLQKQIVDIDNDKNDLLYNKKMLTQMSAEEEDASLRMTSNYYNYLVWIMLMLLIVSLTTNAYLGKDVGSLSYIVVALFLLTFALFIYNWVKNIRIQY